ncbi:MAG: hypothetical protein H0W38_13580 [Methylibium sp.]|nr:hypothetical protein [Methylibium sp.]
MLLIGIVLVVTFALIALERLHKTLAAVLGAVVAVALALLLGVFGGEHPYQRVHDFIEHDLADRRHRRHLGRRRHRRGFGLVSLPGGANRQADAR